MTSYRFFKMPNAERGRSILLPASYLLMLLRSEGLRLSANQISSTYLNKRLIYNYFRFWKTKVRHIGILLPVSISTISPQSACCSASGFRISLNGTIHHQSMTSYRFSRWQLSAMMYLLWSTAGRTTHVPFMVWTRSSNRLFVGLIVPEILRCIDFVVLAWNCLFTHLLGEFWGHILPIWRHLSSWPSKGPFLGGNTSFEPFSVRIGATVRPGRVTE